MHRFFQPKNINQLQIIKHIISISANFRKEQIHTFLSFIKNKLLILRIFNKPHLRSLLSKKLSI